MQIIEKTLIQKMIQWRQHLHSIPELGFDLFETSTFVAGILEKEGIKVHKLTETSLVACIANGHSSTSVALRADMDALPIYEENEIAYRSKNDCVMHACGHDGHTAMLMGAAIHLARNKSFNGQVYFIFQPDEEHGRGAQTMIDEGLFEKFYIDAIFGLHNLLGLEIGKFSVRSGPNNGE